MRASALALITIATLALVSCKKDDDNQNGPTDDGPRLILKFAFDSTQVRLNNLGLPSTIPTGHGAQSPRFNRMSAHYVEFTQTALIPLGSGDVVYHAPETTLGGATAIDHDLGLEVGQGGAFLNIPLSDLSPGSYQYLRVSLAYQNYDIRFGYGTPTQMYNGTIASFIGFNTYIGSFLVHDSTVTVNGNRAQGYWAFEVLNPPIATPVTSGLGSAGATTVVNPLFATSPIPAGSCLATGVFLVPLIITGTETNDIVIQVSLSTNKSFEWIELDGDNIFEPADGETVVDMGVRGLIPTVQ
ncbi:MAG: hypothetical protein IPI81_16835 [Flavobacteriales bacterium]|nr:hypothetical protein [Flavobacteriales bacterium]MCC6939464.1 hypothetical protein [Flavobacteriales bacterium]